MRAHLVPPRPLQCEARAHDGEAYRERMVNNTRLRVEKASYSLETICSGSNGTPDLTAEYPIVT